MVKCLQPSSDPQTKLQIPLSATNIYKHGSNRNTNHNSAGSYLRPHTFKNTQNTRRKGQTHFFLLFFFFVVVAWHHMQI